MVAFVTEQYKSGKADQSIKEPSFFRRSDVGSTLVRRLNEFQGLWQVKTRPLICNAISSMTKFYANYLRQTTVKHARVHFNIMFHCFVCDLYECEIIQEAKAAGGRGGPTEVPLQTKRDWMRKAEDAGDALFAKIKQRIFCGVEPRQGPGKRWDAAVQKNLSFLWEVFSELRPYDFDKDLSHFVRFLYLYKAAEKKCASKMKLHWRPNDQALPVVPLLKIHRVAIPICESSLREMRGNKDHQEQAWAEECHPVWEQWEQQDLKFTFYGVSDGVMVTLLFGPKSCKNKQMIRRGKEEDDDIVFFFFFKKKERVHWKGMCDVGWTEWTNLYRKIEAQACEIDRDALYPESTVPTSESCPRSYIPGLKHRQCVCLHILFLFPIQLLA